MLLLAQLGVGVQHDVGIRLDFLLLVQLQLLRLSINLDLVPSSVADFASAPRALRLRQRTDVDAAVRTLLRLIASAKIVPVENLAFLRHRAQKRSETDGDAIV